MTNLQFNIIMATYGKNNAIGYNNVLPWKCKKDLKYFSHVTKSVPLCSENKIKNVIIMGRNTFRSLNNRPLKDRFNIILSKNIEFKKISLTNR